MALEECRECGEEVSTDADACPSCGAKHPTSESNEALGCLVVVAVLAVVAVVALSATADGDQSETESASSSTPSFTCRDVPSEMIDVLEKGLTAHGDARLEGGQAVLSNTHSQLYYIATRLYGPGLDGDVLIFASNSLDPASGLKMTVNSTAEEFTDWAVGRESDAQVTGFDDGAQAAESCLETGQP